MNDKLTDKTMVIVTKLGDFWVKPDQAEQIMAIKQQDNSASIQLEGNHIAAMVIDGALTAEAYEVLNKKRRGAWQCKYHYWHERNQQCAHAEVYR